MDQRVKIWLGVCGSRSPEETLLGIMQKLFALFSFEPSTLFGYLGHRNVWKTEEIRHIEVGISFLAHTFSDYRQRVILRQMEHMNVAQVKFFFVPQLFFQGIPRFIHSG